WEASRHRIEDATSAIVKYEAECIDLRQTVDRYIKEDNRSRTRLEEFALKSRECSDHISEYFTILHKIDAVLMGLRNKVDDTEQEAKLLTKKYSTTGAEKNALEQLFQNNNEAIKRELEKAQEMRPQRPGS